MNATFIHETVHLRLACITQKPSTQQSYENGRYHHKAKLLLLHNSGGSIAPTRANKQTNKDFLILMLYCVSPSVTASS